MSMISFSKLYVEIRRGQMQDIPSTPSDENCRAEYSVIESAWRFFTGLRFIVAAFAITLQSALFTLFIQLSQSTQTGRLVTDTAIAISGLFTITAIVFIEVRTIQLFRLTVGRGVELEDLLQLPSGFFHRLADPQLITPPRMHRVFTHTVGIRLLYSSIYAVWLWLAYFSLK